MTRDEAVAEINQLLAFMSGRDTEIVTALQNAQGEFEGAEFLPWFLITEVSSISTTADEERVPIPSDFLREYEEDSLHYFNAGASLDEDKWTVLSKQDIQTLRDNLPGSGPPEAYDLVGAYFRMFPTPDDIYTLKMIYYKEDAVLTTDIENAWLKHAPWVLIGRAGTRMAQALHNEDARVEFEKIEAGAAGKLWRFHVARTEENRRRVMGGPD